MGLQNQIPICNCYRTHLRVLLAVVIYFNCSKTHADAEPT